MRVRPAGPIALTVTPDLVELERQREGEADDGGLGGRVAGLAEVAAEAGARRGVDDAAAERCPPWPARASTSRRGARRHQVPWTCTRMTASKSSTGHVPDRGVAHDAGVVDDDVELAEGVDRLLDDLAGLLVVGDVGVSCRRPCRRASRSARPSRRRPCRLPRRAPMPPRSLTTTLAPCLASSRA